MLAKELKSHRKKNMHVFLRTLKGELITPTKEEHTHKIKVRGGIALKESDSFFDWRLESAQVENNEIDHYLKRLLATMRRPTMPHNRHINPTSLQVKILMKNLTKMLKNKVHVSSPMRAKKKSEIFYDNFPLVTKFRRFQRTIMYNFWGALQI